MIKKQKKNSVEVWKKNCTSGLDIIKKNGSENLTILLLIKAGKFVCPFRNPYKIPTYTKISTAVSITMVRESGGFSHGLGTPYSPTKTNFL